jgi:hypothetical protein
MKDSPLSRTWGQVVAWCRVPVPIVLSVLYLLHALFLLCYVVFEAPLPVVKYECFYLNLASTTSAAASLVSACARKGSLTRVRSVAVLRRAASVALGLSVMARSGLCGVFHHRCQ